MPLRRVEKVQFGVLGPEEIVSDTVNSRKLASWLLTGITDPNKFFPLHKKFAATVPHERVEPPFSNCDNYSPKDIYSRFLYFNV